MFSTDRMANISNMFHNQSKQIFSTDDKDKSAFYGEKWSYDTHRIEV